MTSFQLHERLKNDLIEIKDLELSKLMLLPDSENPWCVLVPKRNDIKELHHLESDDQNILLEEINTVSKILEKEFSPDKLNVGALGNMVPQLHIHIICRYKNDRSWPGSIWGTAAEIDKVKLEDIKTKILTSLA